MAAAADERFTPRVDAPVIRAARVAVIVGVFALDKVELANLAAVDELLCELESRSMTANLTDHEFLIRMLL